MHLLEDAEKVTVAGAACAVNAVEVLHCFRLVDDMYSSYGV